jgi:lipopolysaccharide transport system ATP-binding protein
MTRTVVRIEGVTKAYRLGAIGARTLQGDVQRLWARWRGRPDPLHKIGSSGRTSIDGSWVLALDDVSLDLDDGDVVGLIGRNGAGKSTLLKILSRVTLPTRGQVKIRGRIASLLEVGSGFHPELTGRENAYLNGAILGMTREEVRRKFDEIVAFSGLSEFIDTPVKRYSSGMYVRLAFAVAAHLECEILLVDEILAVGDAEFQRRCLGKMQDLSRAHRTVVFVSHNLATVSALCRRGVVLDRGRTQFDGLVDEAVAAYARLIAEAPSDGLQPVEERLGTGRARIHSAYVTDVHGMELQAVQAGASCVLKFAYRADQPIFNPAVNVGVYDATWRRVAFFDSAESGALPAVLPPRATLSCAIDRLPLPPGVYYMNVALKEGSDMLDHVQRVLELHVMTGDFYGTGRLHSHARASLIDNHWNVAAAGDESCEAFAPAGAGIVRTHAPTT